MSYIFRYIFFIYYPTLWIHFLHTLSGHTFYIHYNLRCTLHIHYGTPGDTFHTLSYVFIHSRIHYHTPPYTFHKISFTFRYTIIHFRIHSSHIAIHSGYTFYIHPRYTYYIHYKLGRHFLHTI